MIDTRTVTRKVMLPSIPGLLSVHHRPAPLDAFAEFRLNAEIVMLDRRGEKFMRVDWRRRLPCTVRGGAKRRVADQFTRAGDSLRRHSGKNSLARETMTRVACVEPVGIALETIFRVTSATFSGR